MPAPPLRFDSGPLSPVPEQVMRKFKYDYDAALREHPGDLHSQTCLGIVDGIESTNTFSLGVYGDS